MAFRDLSANNLPTFSGPALSKAERAFAVISVISKINKIPAARVAKFQKILTAIGGTGNTANAKLAADALAVKFRITPPFGTPVASRPTVSGGWPTQAP